MAKIACLITDGFEDVEFRVPYDKLKRAGAEIELVGLKGGEEVTGYRGKEKVRVDKAIADVRPEDYDALFIPGGYSPDHLRVHDEAVEFVQRFDRLGRPLAAVCHAPQLLISARLVKGRTLTAWKTIQGDLELAGANVKDEPVVVDRNWITSRNPGDLQPFSDTIIAALGLGAHRAEEAAPPAH